MGGAPDSTDEIFIDWDGKEDIDATGTAELMKVPARKPGPGDPKPPAGFQHGWIYQNNGAKLLVYYNVGCKLFRRLYGMKYGGISPAEKNRVRELIYRDGSPLFVDGSFVTLPPVIEFEPGVLLQFSKLGVAAKIDGQPFVCVIAGGKGLLCMKRYVKYAFDAPEGPPVVCAGELSDDTFTIFDVMIDGEEITDLPFAERIARAEKIRDRFAGWNVKIDVQKFHVAQNHVEWVSAIDSVDRKTKKTDGYIIQTMDTPYDETVTMKFKPYNELTIDLSQHGRNFYSTRGKKCQLENIRVKDGGDYSVPRIVEINLDSKSITKVRNGKATANAVKTVAQIMDLYENKVDLMDLKGETVQILKANMRRVEARLYDSVANGSQILDIGAGTGRSWFQWKERNYKVWAIEPDAASYAKLRERPGIKTMRMGGEDGRLAKWIEAGSIDAIFMIHSLTFFGGDMTKLVENISHCLRPGGMLIGVGLDGKKLREMLAHGAIDCPAFRIKQTGHDKVVITMKHKKSLVHDQTEYILNYDEWFSRLKAVGIELIETGFMQRHWLMGEYPNQFTEATRVWKLSKRI